MSAKSLSDLRTAARQHSNYEGSGFVTDAELSARVNEAVGALYDEILKARETYFNKPFLFTLAGGIGGNSVSLPSDFYKARALDRNPGTSAEGTIDALPSYNERHFSRGIAYDIDADGLTIYPAAATGAPYRLWYTPLCPVLADPIVATSSYATETLDPTGGAADGTLHNWFFPAAAFDGSYVGKYLYVTGAANAANNGLHVVTSVIDGTDIRTASSSVVSESFGPSVVAVVYDPPLDGVATPAMFANIWTFAHADFVAAGLVAGDTFTVTGTPTNDGTYTVQAVTDAHTVVSVEVPPGGEGFFAAGATVTYQQHGTINLLPVTLNTWALYIELFVAAAILDKAEQDSTAVQSRLNQQIARVQAMAPSRRTAPLQVPLPASGYRFRRFWGG